MASTIILSDNGASSGSAGVKTTGGNDGVLILQTTTSGGTATNAVYVDTSQNVGIGTSSPSYKLDVQTSAASGVVGRFVASGGGASGYMYSGGDFYLASDTSANTSIGLNSSSNYVRFWTNGNERARIDSSGNLLVGTTTAITTGRFVLKAPTTTNLGEWRVSTNGYSMIMYNASDSQVGYISINASTTTYNTGSDYRLKENIAPMTGALSKVAQLKPCTYTWKATGEDGQGFIAHELAEVVPDAVSGEKDAVDEKGNPRYQGVDTSFLVATLTAAIQEQQALITTLTERIAALEAK